MAEGAPLHPTPDKMSLPDVPPGTSLADAVNRVAAAYDYDAQRQNGVFILTKRYTDPKDLPDVTLEECTEAIQDTVKALSTFTPKIVTAPREGVLTRLATDIVGTLSPEQRQALESKAGLPVTSLTSEQQTAVTRWALYAYTDDTLESAQSALSSLRQAPQAQIGLGSMTLGRDGVQSVFGRQTTDEAGHVRFQFLSQGVTLIGGHVDPNDSPLAPTQEEQDAARARQEERGHDGHTTLSQEIAVLNGRGARFQVDAALAAKTVTIAGDSQASPADVLAALSAVYGLRVKPQTNGTTRLTRRPFLVPLDPAAMHADVVAAMPDPLLRAVHLADAEPLQAALSTLAQSLNRPKPVNQGQAAPTSAQALKPLTIEQWRDATSQLGRMQSRIYANQRAAVTLHRAALRSLRTSAETYPPSVRIAGRVPVSAMSQDDRDTLAALYMAEFLQGARDGYGGHGVPDWVTHPDGWAIQGAVYAQPNYWGDGMVKLYLQRPRPRGGFDIAFGMFNVPFRPAPQFDKSPLGGVQ